MIMHERVNCVTPIKSTLQRRWYTVWIEYSRVGIQYEQRQLFLPTKSETRIRELKQDNVAKQNAYHCDKGKVYLFWKDCFLFMSMR